MFMHRVHTHLNRGDTYVEFETAEDADRAMKYMDGAQIDGQEIAVSPVDQSIPRTRPEWPSAQHVTPPRRAPPMGNRWRRSPPPRYRRPAPRWRSPPRRRSRSPVRSRRRYSRSSSSESSR